MRIGIVGWDHTEYESVHLVRASRARGHDAALFTLDDVCWGHIGDTYGVLADGRPAREFDVVVSRAQLRRERWQSDLERLTLLSNLPDTPILDPAAEWVAAESKFVQIQRIGAAGIPVLPTVACSSVHELREALDTWGDTVLKPSFGWEGNDVELIRAAEPLPGAADRLLERYGSMLAQPYVPHPQGDMRLTVVDGEVVLPFRRIPQNGGWKANVAQGARAEPFIPTRELVETALAATRVMGTSIAGVDLMQHGEGHVLIEINNGPGWHPLADNLEWTVANAIVRLAEKTAAGAGRG